MNKKDREEMFNANVGLVHNIYIKHFRYYNNTPYEEDLIQEGLLELYRCTETYNESKGFTFSTYAFKNIYFKMVKYAQRFANKKNLKNKRLENGKYKQTYEGVDIISLNKPHGESKEGYTHTLVDYIADENDYDFEILEDKILVEDILRAAKQVEENKELGKSGKIGSFLELRLNGLTFLEIEKATGISRQTIRVKLREFYEYYRKKIAS